MSKTKVIITIIILSIVLQHNTSFANNIDIGDCLTDASSIEIITTLMDIVLRILGRFWIPFATIAGKLMTNSAIYGEFLNLDKTLYLLRNISRTFANFTLAGILIWKVIQGVINKDLNPTEISKSIVKLAIGAVVANASRFLIGATIDISTILTTTIGALPGTYFSNDILSKNKIIESTQINESERRLTLDTTSRLCDLNKVLVSEKTNTSQEDTSETEAEILDKVLPKNDSISGPLIYIGSSVLKIQRLMYTSNTSNSISDHLMIIIIRFGIVIVFFIAILLILVVNIFRMIYLWFFIAFSPLLAVLFFGNGSASEGESIIDTFLPKFSINNIIKLIFAPVVMTGLLSVLLIVIVLMQQVLQSNNSSVERGTSIFMNQGTAIETNGSTTSVSTIGSPGIFETTLQGNIISNQISNVFSDLLMLGITIVLFWGFIKAIIKYNEDGIGGETIKSIGNMAGGLLSNVPIINIGGAKVGLGTARNKLAGRNGVMNDISRKFGEKQLGQEEDVENMIRESLGQKRVFSHRDYKELTDYTRRIDASGRPLIKEDEKGFFDIYNNKIKNIMQNHYDEPDKARVPLANMSGINESFSSLLKNMANSDFYQKKYNLKPWKESETTVSSYITDNYNDQKTKDFFKTLYENLGGDFSKLNPKSTPSIGEQFWTKGFYRKGSAVKTEEPKQESE